jgi:type IV secretory pathway protease TraF
VLFAVVLLLRTYVAGVYRVDTVSMEPTIHATPERVLVDYRSAGEIPERFGLVVLLRKGRKEAEVKRACGLPRDSVQIQDGDLLFDGERLPADAPRPAPIELFVQGEHDFAAGFSEPEAGFAQDAAGWHLDARAHGGDAGTTGFEWRHPLTDDYLAADRSRVAGARMVGDAIVEFELGVDGGTGRAAWRLSERGDVFELAVDVSPQGAEVRLTREDGHGASELLASAAIDVAPGTWHRFRFMNRDNHLRVDLDGMLGLLSHGYVANRPTPTEEQHLMPRIAFEARGLTVSLRSVRVLRDVHYTDAGVYATRGPLQLGPDEIFVLGDNSAESLDGREWGPVGLDEVIGRPLWVVWPPRALRRLR